MVVVGIAWDRGWGSQSIAVQMTMNHRPVYPGAVRLMQMLRRQRRGQAERQQAENRGDTSNTGRTEHH